MKLMVNSKWPIMQRTGSFVLLVITIILFWPALHGPLILDDHPQLGIYFADSDLDGSQLWSTLFSSSGYFGRPLSMLSFMLNYEFFGPAIHRWKLVNLVLHILCGICIYFLIKKIALAIQLRSGYGHQYLPLIVSGIWLLHPMQISTVFYLVQRMNQLSTLFIILGISVYASARLSQLQGRKSVVYLWASVGLFLPLAVFSKENGILLLPLIALMEMFLFGFAGSYSIRRHLRWFYVFAIVIPIAAGLVFMLLKADYFFVQAYEGRPFSLMERILTQFRVLILYLYQIVMPIPSNFQFFYDNFEISKGLLRPVTTVFSLLLIIILLAGGWFVRRQCPLVAFGIYFFFIAHVLESSILPLELAFEHRNYLPLLGITISVVAILYTITRNRHITTIIGIAMFALVIFSSHTRAVQWSSSTNFYNSVYRINSKSPRINAVMAEELTRQKRYEKALKYTYNTDANGAKLQRLYILCRQHGNITGFDFDKLSENLSPFIDDYAITGLIELANLGLDGKCRFNMRQYAEFLEKIQSMTVKNNSSKAKIAVYNAHYYWQLGQTEKAFEKINLAASLISGVPMPLYLGAEWSLELNRPAQALKYYREANKLRGGRPDSYSQLDRDILNRIRSSIHESDNPG